MNKNICSLKVMSQVFIHLCTGWDRPRVGKNLFIHLVGYCTARQLHTRIPELWPEASDLCCRHKILGVSRKENRASSEWVFTRLVQLLNKKALQHKYAIKPLKDATGLIFFFFLKKHLQVQNTWIIKIHSLKVKVAHTLPAPNPRPFFLGIKSLSWGVKLGQFWLFLLCVFQPDCL